MHQSGQLRIYRSDNPRTFRIAGPEQLTPLPLRDHHFLRVDVSLELASTPDGVRLKVRESSYQYQFDAAGNQWVFRYDYERNPPNHYPAGHLHIRGTLVENCLSSDHLLEDLHFPILRSSIEAVIRLLHEQFGIKCNTAASLWRPMLALSEELFLDIAHKPLSGPRK